jgi:hypothetical protein
MVGITTFLSIITQNISGLNFPAKSIDWQAGIKIKICRSVVYGNTSHFQKQTLA